MGIDLDTLTSLCQKFLDTPLLLRFNGNFAQVKSSAAFYPPQCCLPGLVPEDVAICGKNMTMGGKVVVSAEDNPCHTTETFFTWDALKGINLDISILIIDGLLFFLILVLIEMKAFSRVWSWTKNHLPGYFTYTVLREELDSDVKEEQERMEGGSTDILQVWRT